MPEISLEMDYAHARAGWMKCWFIIDGERHPIEASYVFPPFVPLLYFTRAVAWQRLPAKFYWDEESIGAHFLATAVAEDSPFVHLKIQHTEADAPWLDAEIERAAVVRAFLPPILEFARKTPKAEVDWYTSRKTVEKIEKQIAAGIPLRSDVHAPQPIKFTLHANYKRQYLEGRVFLTAHMHDQDAFQILLFDTHLFWKEWVDFLGKIARAELPAQCEHNRYTTPSANNPQPVWIHRKRILAEPVADPKNFRLKVLTEYLDEEEFLYLDEVVSREQCVRAFVDAFEKFLRKGYQICPDSEGKTFDLRTLPLEGLA